MIKFYGKDSDFYHSLERGCSIAATLYEEAEEPLIRFLFAALYSGVLSYRQFQSMGMFLEKGEFLTGNAKKAVSYYEKAGYLNPAASSRENSRFKAYSLSKKGLLRLMDTLKHEDMLSQEDIDFLPSLFSSTKRWRSLKNIQHYDGISSFMCNILSTSRVSILMRELNIMNFHTHTRATCYFCGAAVPSMRADAYAKIGQALTRECHIFYEQDTGSQSGTVISKKMHSYLPFLLQLKETEPDANIMLLFGLMDKGGHNGSVAYQSSLSLHQNSREYRALKAIHLSLLLQTADCPLGDLVQRIEVLCEGNHGFDLEGALKYIKSSYPGFLQYMGYIGKTGDAKGSSQTVKAHPAAVAGDPDIHTSQLSARGFFAYLTDLLCESKKCLSMEDKGVTGSSTRTDTLHVSITPSVSGFFTRRDLIFSCYERHMDNVDEKNAGEQFSAYALRGNRICCVPTERQREFLPFLCLSEGDFYKKLPDFLLANGITVYDQGHLVKEPVFSNIFFPEHMLYHYRGGRLHVLYENLSFDATSATRLASLCRQDGYPASMQMPFLVVCFFLREDLVFLRKLLRNNPGLCHHGTMHGLFSAPGTGDTLFVCMEDFLEGNFNALRFSKDGLGAYRLVMDPLSGPVYRFLLPEAHSVSERAGSVDFPFNDD